MNAQLKPLTRFGRESIATVIDETRPLLEAHYREIAHYQDIPLSCDYSKYLSIEAKGFLRIFTVRAGTELVGYSIFGVSLSMHYSTSLQAKEDVLWLAPEYRRGRIGWKFIEYCDEQLRKEGIQVVHRHEKIAHPALGRLLQKIGYTPMDTIWTKRLDR